MGGEADGDGEGVSALTDGTALGAPADEAGAEGDGDADVQAVCATTRTIASAPPMGAAARLPEGALRQNLSACLRCARG